MEYRVVSLTPENTQTWGKQLGRCLRGGDVVALRGDLGAGKTAFVQGVGVELGVKEFMTSPTYTFMNEYVGHILDTDVRLIHMDLYRLQRPEEAEVIGVEDAFVENAICLIEWAERAVDYLPDDQLEIKIIGSGDQPREIIFRAQAGAWESRLKDLF